MGAKQIALSTEKDHAFCGASSAHQWLACPGSVGMQLRQPESGQSVYAAEGQLAHDLSEIYLTILTNHYHKTGRDLRQEVDIREFETLETKEDYPLEMREHCWDYACLIMDDVMRHKPKKVLIERKVFLNKNYGMFGTSDCFFAYRNKKKEVELRIYDLKYGKGYAVEIDSPQLPYYAIAVANTFKLEPAKYHLNIFQPRADHPDGPHRTKTLTGKQARKIEKELVAGAKKALEMSQNPEEELELVAGERQCFFCSAQSCCKAYTQFINEQAGMDFADDPDLLVPEVIDQRFEIASISDEQISKILRYKKDIERYLSNMTEYAINRYEEGNPIPGWKVVETKPRRKIRDEFTQVKTGLQKLGIKDPCERKIRALGSLERELREVQSVTAKEAKKLLEPFVTMTTPNKTLAPDSDERPGISGAENAKRDFEAIKVEAPE